MPLDPTIGGVAANSYQTAEEADEYFADHLHAGPWTNASEGDKDKALIMATRRLEQEEYVGDKATETQALSFPRRNRVSSYSRYAFEDLNGKGYDSESIPQPMKSAQAELALAFLQSNLLGSGGALTDERLEAAEVGPIKLGFGSATSVTDGTLPIAAAQYLRGLVLTGTRVVRA